MITFPFIQTDHRMGILWHVHTVFPSDTELSMRLPDSASIFTAEIWAIITALEEIKNASESKFIIFTDSLSCLQALLYMKLEHPLIGMAIRKCVFLNIANKDIILCWVPSHVGIRGNEKADSAAKSALDLPHAQVGVPYTDFKLLISQYIFSTWQDDWNGAVANRLHSVKPVLGDWQSSYRRCRKDEVVLCRARIGDTNMTHSYILKKDPPPQCEHCQCMNAFGLASNNFIYLLSNTALCAGCFGNDFILVAYCRDSFARLAPKQGSCASTYKLSTGEVRNAPRQSLSLSPWLCMGSSICK